MRSSRTARAARLSWVQLCQASTSAAAQHKLGSCHPAVPVSLAQWEAGNEGHLDCSAPHLQATRMGFSACSCCAR